MLELLSLGLTFWLLGVIWTILMMAEPGISRSRLLFGGLLWPLLTIITIVGILIDLVISPFRSKPTKESTEKTPKKT